MPASGLFRALSLQSAVRYSVGNFTLSSLRLQERSDAGYGEGSPLRPYISSEASSSIDLSRSFCRDLVTRLGRERPRAKATISKFDVDVVLDQLLKPPFVGQDGTDRTISKLLFVYKTAFLLSLATRARSSELHALSRDPRLCTLEVEAHSGRQTLTIYTQPGFVATNEDPQAARVPRVIPSLAHMYGRHYVERGLCPVWAINIYRAMTPNGPYPVGNDLLLQLPTPTVSMKSSVVAVWIKKCIELTYDAACLEVTAVSAHEVRAIANSLCFHVGAPLNEVCAGGCWRSTNSFFNHYLRSMTGTQAGSARPVVAAGKLIT